MKTSVKIVGVMAGTQTAYLPNASQACYCYTILLTSWVLNWYLSITQFSKVNSSTAAKPNPAT